MNAPVPTHLLAGGKGSFGDRYELYWRSRAEKAEKELGMATDRYNAQILDANRRAIALAPGADKDREAASTRAFDAEIDSTSAAKKKEIRATDIADGKFCTSCGAEYDSAETSVPRPKYVRVFKPNLFIGFVQALGIFIGGGIACMVAGLVFFFYIPGWWFGCYILSWLAAYGTAGIVASIRHGNWVALKRVPLSEKRRCSLAGQLKEARAALKAEKERCDGNTSLFEMEMDKKNEVIASMKVACRAEVERLVSEINGRLARLSKETVQISKEVKSDQTARIAIGHDYTDTKNTPYTSNEAIMIDGKPKSKVVATFSWLDDHEVKPGELVIFKRESMPRKM